MQPMAATSPREILAHGKSSSVLFQGIHIHEKVFMTTMSPAEAFVETLVAQGVKQVFGMLGTGFLPAMDLFDLAGIRFVTVVHEQTAAHMADGYARSSGKHGVVAVQNGPGVTNLVTGIATAYWAHSPVVAITPESPTTDIGRGGLQECDQMPLFQSITKHQIHIPRSDRLAELTNEAFDIAMQERGPVQINIPCDLFEGKIDVDVPVPRSIERSAGGPESLKQAAELLSNAKNPVIIAGGGLVMGAGVAEATALAEHLGAPVLTVFRHGDAFPNQHPLYAGALGYMGSKAGMELLAKADVVVALGSRFYPLTLYPQYGMDYWPKAARIIQVDTDFKALQKVTDRTVDVSICGDAGLAATEILNQLHAAGSRPEASVREARQVEIAARMDHWAKELEGMSQSESKPIMPRRAHMELQRAMPSDAMITLDTGANCGLSQSYIRFDRPRSLFGPMNFACIGCGMGVAMGAKLGQPDRLSVLYVGDGAWAMTMPELLTAKRENIAVVVVVFNNRQYGAEKAYQLNLYGGRTAGSDLENPDFAAVARAMGVAGTRIESADQIGDALRAAIAADEPTVLDIAIDRDLEEPLVPFPAGPKTYLPKYQR